jgi:hypothetical protein
MPTPSFPMDKLKNTLSSHVNREIAVAYPPRALTAADVYKMMKYG